MVAVKKVFRRTYERVRTLEDIQQKVIPSFDVGERQFFQIHNLI